MNIFTSPLTSAIFASDRYIKKTTEVKIASIKDYIDAGLPVMPLFGVSELFSARFDEIREREMEDGLSVGSEFEPETDELGITIDFIEGLSLFDILKESSKHESISHKLLSKLEKAGLAKIDYSYNKDNEEERVTLTDTHTKEDLKLILSDDEEEYLIV